MTEEHTSELQSHDNLVCLEFRRVLFRSEEHTSELQSHDNLVCRLLLEKKQHERGPLPRRPQPLRARPQPLEPPARPRAAVRAPFPRRSRAAPRAAVSLFFFLLKRRPRASPPFPTRTCSG